MKEYNAVEKLHEDAEQQLLEKKLANQDFIIVQDDANEAHAQVTQDIAVKFADYIHEINYIKNSIDGNWSNVLNDPITLDIKTTTELYNEFLKTL